MNTKEVNIFGTPGRTFKQYLNVVKVFNPFNKLRQKELNVLSELLISNHTYKHLEPVVRWKLIFHKDNKVSMRENIRLTEASFNNALTSLRRNKIIINNSIPEKYLVDLDKGYSVKLNFKVENK